MIRLFISYRRSDSTHAAQRVRACMQAKFGADAVFIDRDIPPGSDWARVLRERLQDASDVVVLIGDEFLKELQGHARGGDQAEERDWLAQEIEIALQLKKTIYPVLIGRLDMPDGKLLPEGIRAFADAQAVFAREPAFDAAMGVLGQAVAARHGWVAPPVADAAGAAGGGPLVRAGTWWLGGSGALLLAWLTGRLIRWLAVDTSSTPGAAGATQAEAFFMLGVLYLMLTLVGGLGPYLVYRAVAELRARAHLPVHSLLGTLTMSTNVVALLAGGLFLLMSTRADWALRLIGLLPEQPTPLHYAVQGVVLLAIVFAAIVVAMLEPLVRTWESARRRIGMAGLQLAAVVVLLAALWFAGSVARSLPPMRDLDIVSMVGYFMLVPALSAVIWAWDLARWTLGLAGRAWHNRALLGLALGLYAICTLAYFAHGPVRLFMALP